ncbi:serine/threonine-protein phosphatase 1 regulatory subunit 10 isoform X2 [Parasteatoda tepidariorum]|uniref:serine/threonine-protein phosphatase 1 regulatory subunit 10 isoform X2 n=1 Tax=Parasteatoda tepidariorum TaxID=114398 RepID=UPI00077FA338|nr:serine/threonine-protein phosphatase 1 regulatory subunit 10 isoform X2 [Parasteatoda tepidariorum]
MTRFLKLVRHEDGKWKALSTETDELSEEIAIKEKTYAPIDPQQLLKALDGHLSPSGGINGVKDVPRLASLMKKFSKKLVSRCVYCNVLQATEPDILSEYLDKGGWETINLWLQYAKTSLSHNFLLEMLKLCKQLPMTLERLKENNTAKLVKALTKHENEEVKNLSTELVTKWMSIIKEKKATEVIPVVEKKKKKEKSKPEPEKTEPKPAAKAESPKGAGKVKGTKRPSSEKELTMKETKKEEFYEDVKIDPEPLLPPPKKAKPDRPKTAKIYQKKFRATGLEEETPLPKNISKKSTSVDKSTVVAAKNALKSPVLPERVTEKKIKPESLMTINESPTQNKGIKLIPAKPRPAYILHESASFMDALTSQPVAPIKKRKKTSLPNKAATSPTSPTLAAPKLQFYKDTLETSEDTKSEENASTDDQEKSSENADLDVALDSEEPMEVVTEEGGKTPPNNEVSNASDASNETKDSAECVEDKQPLDPNHLRSILSHGRRKSHKKSVKWVEDVNLKEIFYFELDETERINVLKHQNFGDMKSIELKREREALELMKRSAGDRMEEMIHWWMFPILIDAPPPLVEPGAQSKEKELERVRQQATLQEIYFTREMIPDSPHEPDLEIVPPQEPKVIPLDEENAIGAVMDYSHMELPKPSLPDVISTLMKLQSNRTLLPLPNNVPEQIPHDMNLMGPPLMSPDLMKQMNPPMSLAQPYDPADPVSVMPANSMIPPNMMMPPNEMPIMFNNNSMALSPDSQNVPPPPEWKQPFYGNYPNEIPPMNQGHRSNMNQGPNMNQEPPHNMPHGPGMNMEPHMNHGPGIRPRMIQDNYRPPPKGPSRGMVPRPRHHAHKVPCRHFIGNGCRFGMKCTFLHPGINGPPL